MKIEEFQSITGQIAQNLTNQALVTELLTKLNDGYSEVKTTFDTVQEQTKEHQKEISQLQKTNMQLFLKQGQTPIAPDKLNDPTPLTYDDVLKSLGG